MVMETCNQRMIDAGMKMGDVLRDMGEILGGRGGGKPNLAQGAKMTNLDKLDEAFTLIKNQIGEL